MASLFSAAVAPPEKTHSDKCWNCGRATAAADRILRSGWGQATQGSTLGPHSERAGRTRAAGRVSIIPPPIAPSLRIPRRTYAKQQQPTRDLPMEALGARAARLSVEFCIYTRYFYPRVTEWPVDVATTRANSHHLSNALRGAWKALLRLLSPATVRGLYRARACRARGPWSGRRRSGWRRGPRGGWEGG